ncbi:hypothetical protein QJS04_geneDACA011538 [Acorus gramineus]|uniref:Uncharacterized protein n=1 Tax=Acorus gramineus TaxID=55184 RepID=A0AAV9ACI4_ACOGR|nr:hypothetical protein QJS04_geneDACA011538 [Acorus gramineus]
MAAMGTRLWEIASNHCSLWASWMKARYCRRTSVWNAKFSSSGSALWQKILKSIEWIREQLQFLIFEGKSIKLWDDPWLNGFGLKHHFNNQALLLWGPPDETTVDYLISNGKWQKPERWPPEFDHIWEDISQLEVGGKGPDILVWMGNKTGIVTCSSAWQKVKEKRPILIGLKRFGGLSFLLAGAFFVGKRNFTSFLH